MLVKDTCVVSTNRSYAYLELAFWPSVLLRVGRCSADLRLPGTGERGNVVDADAPPATLALV